MSDYHTIIEYHERSKHRLERYAPGPRALDWANQPNPFRTFGGAAPIELALAAQALPTGFSQLRAGALPAPSPIALESVSVLFELSLAISAWKAYGATSWALRCNPSSGNLHPTEAYLLTADIPGLSAGIYHYNSRDHALERRAALAMADVLLPQGLLVGIASIQWREAWKYGMRAFRYCQHDCGHAIAALSYAAAALGWQARLIDTAGDSEIAALLGLDRDSDFGDAEREEPECLLSIGPGCASATGQLLPGAKGYEWSGQANRLSADHVEWPDMALANAATRKPRTRPEHRLIASPPKLVSRTALHLPAATIFRRRRSAVDFDGVTAASAQAFFAMLEALLPSAAPPWNSWPWPAHVHLALFVHRVDGLEPGLYAFVRDAAALPPLQQALHGAWLWHKAGPAHLPLYLLQADDMRDAGKLICCHQDIAADSCFSLGMLASFEDVEQAPWRYRTLYWECGLIGQALYLEAEAAGLSATGIGCFFDDEMHRLLGLQGQAWQSLYHFTVGGAVEDTRLTTLPAYATRPAGSS
jgi:SagB-type dehydrogenase family enzyme